MTRSEDPDPVRPWPRLRGHGRRCEGRRDQLSSVTKAVWWATRPPLGTARRPRRRQNGLIWRPGLAALFAPQLPCAAVGDLHTRSCRRRRRGPPHTQAGAASAAGGARPAGSGRPREAFDRILRWTLQNLSGQPAGKELAGKQWGRADDGTWRVLPDSNSATDADLWIAYTLAEAARLWNEQRYANLGAEIARNILRQEVATVPGLGTAAAARTARLCYRRQLALESQLPAAATTTRPRKTDQRTALGRDHKVLGAGHPRLGAQRIRRRLDRIHTQRIHPRSPPSRGVGSYDAIRVYLCRHAARVRPSHETRSSTH